MKGPIPSTFKSSSLEAIKIPTPSPDRSSNLGAPSMLERDRSARKLWKLKDLENAQHGEDENRRQLASRSARKDSKNNIPKEYKITVTERDVRKSSIYKAEGWLPKRKDRILRGELDIKNQVLADKRRSLLKILKEKRTAS